MPFLIESGESPVSLKPREKIVQYGIESLDDAELLSVILRTGYAGMEVGPLAKYLLSQFGTRGLFAFTALEEFRFQSGLPPVKSCVLLAVGEVIRRLQKKDNTPIQSSEQFFDYIKDDFKKAAYEQLRIVCVDPRRRVLYSGLIAQGESNSLSVTLASVLHHPIRLNAKNFYLAHNHPGGTAVPSEDDTSFTRRVKKEAEHFGLSFDDHLIIAEEGYYSFSLEGVL